MENSYHVEEKRSYMRIRPLSYKMKVYTSITPAAYTVDVLDISKSGAMLRTKHIPDSGETITFELMDDLFQTLYMGNATVARVVSDAPRTERGFAIRFDEILGDKLFDSLGLSN